MAVKPIAGEGEVMAEINITPFTDVLLVLLIIFMVAATAVVQNGFNINLPKADTATTTADTNSNILVAIAVPDKVTVNGAAVAQPDLEGLLRRLKENKNTDRVIIMADGDVEYLQVIQVMDTAKAAGLKSISMASTPKEPAAPAK